MISFGICKLGILLFSTISLINGQTVGNSYGTDTDAVGDEYTSLPSIHPIRSIFTPEEFSTIRTAAAITLTPLKFEEKLSKAWSKGRNDAIKDLAKNVTAEGGGLNLETILRKNVENTIQMTPEQLRENLIRAYQLGGLHAINKVRQNAQKSLPSIRVASTDELSKMKKEHRAMIRAIRELGGDGELQKLSREHHSEFEEKGELNVNEYDINQDDQGAYSRVRPPSRFERPTRRCPLTLTRRQCRLRRFANCPACVPIGPSYTHHRPARHVGEREREISESGSQYEYEEMNNLNNLNSYENEEISSSVKSIENEKLDSLFDVQQFGRWGWGFGWHRPWFGGWGFRPWGWGFGFGYPFGRFGFW